MALKNIIDVAKAQAALTVWLAEKYPTRSDIRVYDCRVPKESGISAETLMFNTVWAENGNTFSQELVARVQPTTGGVWERSDLQAEFDVLSTLSSATKIPVPKVYAFERDEAVLGAPFLLMEMIRGRVPADDPPFTAAGWVLDLTPDEQARLYDNGLQALAAIHKLDWKALGLGTLADTSMGRGSLDGLIDYWRRFYAFSANGRPSTTIDAAFDWLDDNRPQTTGSVCLNWGDARPGNIIYAEDLSVAAVIDWELLDLGNPELDLGWWLFILRHHTEGIGMPMPKGFPSDAQTVSRYEELSGHKVQHLKFYYVLAATRVSIAFLRAGYMMIAQGLLPADATMPISNPASQLLARELGLPSPGGTSQTFIGNR